MQSNVLSSSYTKPKEYVVTEWPLKSTLGEFWSLVYDQECAAVVVLCQPPHSSVCTRKILDLFKKKQDKKNWFLVVISNNDHLFPLEFLKSSEY